MLWSPQHHAEAGIPPQAVWLEPQCSHYFPEEGGRRSCPGPQTTAGREPWPGTHHTQEMRGFRARLD